MDDNQSRVMTKWDREVCERLDFLWDEYQSGRMKTVPVERTLVKARAIVEKARKEQENCRTSNYSSSEVSCAV